MHRHLDACVPAVEGGTLHLVVDAGAHWLHLAGAPDLRLEELDAFLRAFWLECCDHLSSFEIGGRVFCAGAKRVARFGAASTRARVADALIQGEVCRYTYDLGTPTELLVKRRRFAPSLPAGARLAVLARNLPLSIPCAECHEPATELCSLCQVALCEDCAKEHVDERGCEEGLLPLLDSPRVGVCAYVGPAGGFTLWPLSVEGPGAAPVDEPTRRVIDALLERPPADECELQERLGSLDPHRLPGLLLARLEQGEGASWIFPALSDLMGTQGVRAEQRRLVRVFENPDLPPEVRNVALSLLSAHAPEAVAATCEMSDKAVEPLLREGMRDVLDLVLEDETGPELLAELLEKTDAEARPLLLSYLREQRLEEGVPAGLLYCVAARRPALAAVRPMFVEAFAQEGGAAAVELLEELVASAEGPDERRELQQALLRARTATIERPEIADVDEDGDYALVSSCDGDGAYNVAACQRDAEGRYRMSVVCIRASQGVRDGWVRTGISQLDIEEMEELFEEDAHVFHTPVSLACGAALVAAGVARSRANGASIPPDAAAALAIFESLGLAGDVPVPEVEPLDLGLDGCRELLEFEEYASWLFDRGDLQSRGIPPAPLSDPPSARSAWVRRAAGRLEHAALRERLLGMTEHMARWHAWRDEREEAGICEVVAHRLRDPAHPLGDEPLVHAMLERSVPDEGPRNEERPPLADKVGDRVLRDRIRRGLLRVEGVPRARHLALLDLAELGFFALEEIFQGLPGERRPRDGQQLRAAFEAGRVFTEAIQRSVAGEDRGSPAFLRREIARVIGSTADLDGEDAACCAAELLEALGDFVRNTCGACRVRCFAQPDLRVRPLFEGASHPAHPGLGLFDER